MNRPCWTFDLVFSTVANGWGWAAGSSSSTAFVSGAAALILSKEKELSPALLKDLLVGNARQKGRTPGKNVAHGFGFVNAFKEDLVADHNHATTEIVDGTLQVTDNEHLSPQGV